MEPFNPYTYRPKGMHPYAEGNAWQYNFFVPHDVPDMIALMGGNKKFEKELDHLFADTTRVDLDGGGNASGFIGQFAHGNEPSHHCAYLYNWVGADRALLHQQGDDRAVLQPHRRLLGQRGLRTDVVMVHLVEHGLLPRRPRVGVVAPFRPQLRRAQTSPLAKQDLSP